MKMSDSDFEFATARVKENIATIRDQLRERNKLNILISKLLAYAILDESVILIKLDGLRDGEKWFTIVGPEGRLSGDHSDLTEALETALKNLEDKNK